MDLFAFVILGGILVAILYSRIKGNSKRKQNGYYNDNYNPGYFNDPTIDNTLHHQYYQDNAGSTITTDDNWNNDNTDSSDVDSSNSDSGGSDSGGDSGGSSD